MIAGAGTAPREFAFTARDFERVRGMIHAHAGIALGASKEEMVYSRIVRRLRALQLDSFEAYLDRLESGADGAEWESFTNALTTNQTSFFREEHHFEVLQGFLKARPAGSRLRIWCAGVSSGEEAYSLAISACEAFDTFTPPVAILATDIDTQVLGTAARGVYPLDAIDKLTIERKKRFFLKGQGAHSGACRVIEPLRSLITFRVLNLLDAPYPMRGPFDAIFCRNVMIYFDRPTQLALLGRMIPLLAHDGLFFAGHSESFFHAGDLIRPVGRTVYRRADPGP